MRQRKREPSFIEQNPEYLLIYNSLLKDASFWNNSAQYWLGREATRRGECLLRGDIPGYKQVIHSEELHYPHVIYNQIPSKYKY